jgi:hypothetical protein
MTASKQSQYGTEFQPDSAWNAHIQNPAAGGVRGGAADSKGRGKMKIWNQTIDFLRRAFVKLLIQLKENQ